MMCLGIFKIIWNNSIYTEFKGGKESVIGSFVGQVMKKTQGKANPQAVSTELVKQLKA